MHAGIITDWRPAPAPDETYCWLVERVWAPAPGSVHTQQYRQAEWLRVVGGLASYTTKDAWDAIRFPDKAATEAAIAMLHAAPEHYEWRATDHIFIHSAGNRA